MAYKSSFFDAEEQDGVYDRNYIASDFAEYFSQLLTNGVFPSESSLMVESAGGMQVLIRPGHAFINGYLFSIISGTTEVLTVPVADGTFSRIDSVIIGLDLINRQITPYIRSGNPAVLPEPVSLVRSGTTYELEIAQILVPAGSSQVMSRDIWIKTVDSERCGFVTGIYSIGVDDLYHNFADQFNEWFSNLQTNLDGDVAANLTSRLDDVEDAIDTFESAIQNQGKLYSIQYTGAGSSNKSISVPFSPRRIVITALCQVTKNGQTVYGKDELEIVSSTGENYTGVFSRFWPSSSYLSLCSPVQISIESDSAGGYSVSWEPGNSTNACNESGKVYHVTVWGV